MQTTLLLAIATMEQDAGACSPASLEPYAAYPADGSADVAVDSQIVGELRGSMGAPSCCPLQVLQDGEPVTGTTESICNETIGWNLRCHSVFTPDSTLSANTEYTVSFQGWEEWGQEYHFTTGSGYSSTSSDAPTLLFKESELVPEDQFSMTSMQDTSS